MGRQARERKERRSKALAKWAQENPARFEAEWNKRLDSWLHNIWQSAADSITLTEEQYRNFVCRYPGAKCLDTLVRRNSEGDYILYLHCLQDNQRDALGKMAVKELIANVTQGVLRGKSIFSIVDHAKKTLMECGEKAVELQLHETTELLNNECCRMLAPYVRDKKRKVNIYNLSQNYEEHGKYKVTNRAKP